MTERVARELVPVLRDEPKRVAQVWHKVVEEHGSEPTAAKVRYVVRRKGVNGAEPSAGPTKRAKTKAEPRSREELKPTSETDALAARKRIADLTADLRHGHGPSEHAPDPRGLVSSPEDFRYWTKVISSAVSALRQLRKALAEEKVRYSPAPREDP